MLEAIKKPRSFPGCRSDGPYRPLSREVLPSLGADKDKNVSAILAAQSRSSFFQLSQKVHPDRPVR